MSCPSLNTGHHLSAAVLLTQALCGSPLSSHGVAKGREAESRVEDGEDEDGNDDHHTLEGNELGLVPHELTSPATSKLWNTVCASSENGDVGHDNSAHEATELGVVEE